MYRKNPVSAIFLRARHDATLRLMDGLSPASILDIGCDDGVFLGRLAQRFPSARLRGCDREAGALAEARTACPRAELARGDFMELECDTADLVALMEVLEHSPDPGAMLRKAASLTGRKGRILISTPRPELLRWRLLWSVWSNTFGRRWKGEHRDLSEAALVALASECGLVPERRAGFFFGCISIILFKPR